MAKSSISQKKTLKHLFFTKSTTDLQECGEKKEKKFQSLFKRREKKDKRGENDVTCEVGQLWKSFSLPEGAETGRLNLWVLQVLQLSL
ncbi:uncharacterized protein crybg2 [Tachysurus ichikawai]